MFPTNNRLAGVVACAALLGSVAAAPASTGPLLPSVHSPPGPPFGHPVPSHRDHSILHSSIGTLPTIEPFLPMPTGLPIPESNISEEEAAANFDTVRNDAQVTGIPRPITTIPVPFPISTHGVNATITTNHPSGVPTGRPCEVPLGSGPGPVGPHSGCVPDQTPPHGDPHGGSHHHHKNNHTHTTNGLAPGMFSMPSASLDQRDHIITMTETAPGTTWTQTFTVPDSWMTGSPEVQREMNTSSTTTTTSSTTLLTWPTHGWATHHHHHHHHHHSHSPNATQTVRPHKSHNDTSSISLAPSALSSTSTTSSFIVPTDSTITTVLPKTTTSPASGETSAITSSSAVLSSHPGQPTVLPGLDPLLPPTHPRPSHVPAHGSGRPSRLPTYSQSSSPFLTMPHTEGLDARSETLAPAPAPVATNTVLPRPPHPAPAPGLTWTSCMPPRGDNTEVVGPSCLTHTTRTHPAVPTTFATTMTLSGSMVLPGDHHTPSAWPAPKPWPSHPSHNHTGAGVPWPTSVNTSAPLP